MSALQYCSRILIVDRLYAYIGACVVIEYKQEERCYLSTPSAAQFSRGDVKLTLALL